MHFKSFHTRLTLLLLAVTCCIHASAQSPASWNLYRPDGGDFESLFPSAPDITPLGEGRVRYQAASAGAERLVLQVMRADVGDVDSSRLEDAVAGLKEGLAKSGARTLSESPATLGGCPARELILEHPQFFARMRMIVAGRRAFTAGVAAESTSLLRSPEAEAFLASFRPLRGCDGKGSFKDKAESGASSTPGGSPSLEETLSWLREKLTTHAPNEMRSNDGRLLGTWFKLVRFEGCELTWREEMYTEKGTLSGETTIHLGDLNPEGTKIQQDILSGLYFLDLYAPAGKSLVRHRVISDGKEMMSFADETARLRFREMDMARRVDRAFAHAARLCAAARNNNRKEPF